MFAKNRILALLLCLSLIAPGGALAQPKSSRKVAAEKVSLDFRDIELTDLIQTISELTGKNFIYDENVRGKATIISPDPMTLDQAYHLFLTVLNVKGFTVVPSGKVNKIVATRDAKEQNLPTVSKDGRYTGDQYITRVIRLENADANAVATTVLAPLVSKTSSVVAYPPSNTLIITDYAANIERLMKIVRELDTPEGFDLLEVIPLRHADATEVSQLINQVLTGGGGAGASRRRARAQAAAQAQGGTGQESSRVLPYGRTNALVALASEEDMDTIRQLVAQLDQATTQANAGIRVYYLENADAEALATTLNQIVTGIRTPPRTGTNRPGQPAGQPGGGQTPGQPSQAMEALAITADKPTNSLIINGTAEDFETLKTIIKQLDVKRRQVFVEALILELSMDATKRLGASLQGAFAVDDGFVFGSTNLNQTQGRLPQFLPSTGTGTNNQTSAPSILTQTLEGIFAGGIFNLIEVDGPGGTKITVPALSALIDLSKSTSDVNILSAPRLLTTDNQEAEIIVGQNVPIITQRLTDTGASAGLAQSVAVERRDVALTLRFTPQITEGNLVRLNVLQEITDIASTSVGDVNQVGPTLTKRLVRNTVLAENGRTVVLGGLISNNQQETISKVPLLGDIPGLGWLFKHKETINRKTNLLIFITPRVIRDANDLASVTRRSHEDMERFKQGVYQAEPDLTAPAPVPLPAPAGPTPVPPPATPAPATPGV